MTYLAKGLMFIQQTGSGSTSTAPGRSSVLQSVILGAVGGAVGGALIVGVFATIVVAVVVVRRKRREKDEAGKGKKVWL